MTGQPDTRPDLPRTFLGLEALRGAAALVVVIRHGGALFGLHPRSAHLAVDMFFLLSGFVLAHAYRARLAHGLGAAGFLRLRLVRLWPLYLLALALAAAEHMAWRTLGLDGPWSGRRLAAAFALNAFFLPARGPLPDLFPTDSPAWSLMFELVANVAFACAAPHLTRRRLFAATLLGALALAATALLLGGLNEGWRWTNAWAGLVRVGFAFTGGVLLQTLSPAGAPWKVPAWAPTLALGVLLFVDAGRLQPAYEFATAALLSPFLVWLGAGTRPAGHEAQLCRTAGAASYGVYVLHVPLLAALTSWMTYTATAPRPPLTGAACLLFLFALTLSLDRYYDHPARRLIAGILTKRRGRRGSRLRAETALGLDRLGN